MRRSDDTFPVTNLLAGIACGQVLKLTEPLNAWGGLDPDSGLIVHRSHPQRGRCVAARVLVMPQSRGSGTNAQVFAQAWANGRGPVAVILGAPDYVLCVGAVVGRELYKVTCPVVVADPATYDALSDGDEVTVAATDDHATVRIDGHRIEQDR
jgi:predicted aconitase with swiveling domain